MLQTDCVASYCTPWHCLGSMNAVVSLSLAWDANESPSPALSSCPVFSFVDVEKERGRGPRLEHER